jgi:ArsR family transcriptional regulator, arsenate/arsenite/antimonite-responsive transcriptional repressor
MKPKCCQNKESVAELKRTVEFLKVVAEENRLKILCMLRSGEKCVCDIWQFLDFPQNLTSHHLKVLKDFGLVNDRKEGLKVHYSINKKQVIKYNSLLNKFLQSYGK